MAYNITWDGEGERFYENGISNVALYVYDSTNNWYGDGVAWNGVTSISDDPEGADANDLWADNIKYGTLRSAEKVSGSIGAYTYPEEFEACDGVSTPVPGMKLRQQSRSKFALCYRTEIGSDASTEAGYKIHFLYGLTASPSSKDYDTINDSPDAIEFSWDFESTPVSVTLGGTTYKPTSCIEIDSRDVPSANMTALLEKAYGVDTTPGVMPTPAEIFGLVSGTTEPNG